MKLKHILITTFLFIFPYQLYADTLGVYIGGGLWDHSASGTFRDNTAASTTTINFEDDLKLKDEQEGYFYIAFEHPMPLVPNIKFASTKMSHKGSGTITIPVTFGGQNFIATESVTSKIQLDATDITAYYEVLDNVVELDLGLTARKIEGGFAITGTGATGEQLFNETIPLLYAALSINLPAGFQLNAEGNFIGVNDVSYTDLTVKLRYEIVGVLGIEGGVRSQDLEVTGASDITADIKFSGPFVGLFVHF